MAEGTVKRRLSLTYPHSHLRQRYHFPVKVKVNEINTNLI
jgi:hypothetical protein